MESKKQRLKDVPLEDLVARAYRHKLPSVYSWTSRFYPNPSRDQLIQQILQFQKLKQQQRNAQVQAKGLKQVSRVNAQRDRFLRQEQDRMAMASGRHEVKLVKVADNGSCYFYALHGSLQDQGLLDRVCNGGFACDREGFARDFRAWLVANPELQKSYTDLWFNFCQTSDDLSWVPLALDSLPFWTTNLLLKYIPNEEQRDYQQYRLKHLTTHPTTDPWDLIRGLADSAEYGQREKHYNLPVNQKLANRTYSSQDQKMACRQAHRFVEEVLETLRQPTFLLGQIEIRLVQKLLVEFGITVNVLYRPVAGIMFEPNAVYILNNEVTKHFDYYRKV